MWRRTLHPCRTSRPLSARPSPTTWRPRCRLFSGSYDPAPAPAIARPCRPSSPTSSKPSYSRSSSRKFSAAEHPSPTKHDTVEHCTKTLSWMGAHLSQEGGEHMATEWARQLSPSTRRELARMRSLTRESNTNTLQHEKHIPEPPKKELRLVALSQAIPFIGFGFMDNAILIVAGDAIDTSLGVMLGISTMCAAAIGNIVSDVAGILLGTVIEDFSARLGIPVPNVTAAQRSLRSVRFASQFGCGAGIVIGCIIGMFPLLLIDSNKVQKMKQEAHMDSIFRDVVEEAKGLIGAQATRIFIVVDSEEATMPSSLEVGRGEQFLYGKYVYGALGTSETRIRVGKGIVSRAVLTGEAVNIFDVQSEPDFAQDIWDKIGQKNIQTMVCVPVFDSQGHVIAVIQAVNKQRGQGLDSAPPNAHEGFTDGDVQVLKVLASHISVSLQSMYDEDAELTLRDTMKVLKEHGLAGLMDETVTAGQFKHRKLFPE